MSSPPVRVVYKLVQQGVDGITRRLTFDSQPTWPELALRVHDLYFIPLDDIGLVYVDEDEITISSNAELRDYHDGIDSASTKKLFVRNLAVSGARRPSSNSSGSSFSHLKYSPEPGPVEQSVFSLPPPASALSSPPSAFGLPPPPSERGRSSSPVILSESRVIAERDAEQERIQSFFQSLLHRDAEEIEVVTRESSPRPRSRSFSPSFIKMCQSPRSVAEPRPRSLSRDSFVQSRSESPRSSIVPHQLRTPPLQEVPRGFFGIAYSRPHSPSVIPTAAETYMTTEEVLRFATPLSRPLSSVYHQSFNIPERLPSRDVSPESFILPRSHRSQRSPSQRSVITRSDLSPNPSQCRLPSPPRHYPEPVIDYDPGLSVPSSPAPLVVICGTALLSRTPPSYVCVSPSLACDASRPPTVYSPPASYIYHSPAVSRARSPSPAEYIRSRPTSCHISRSPAVSRDRSPSPREYIRSRPPSPLEFFPQSSRVSSRRSSRGPTQFTASVRCRSRTRSPSMVSMHRRDSLEIEIGKQEEYMTIARENLVKTTLEQLRDVSQGVMASLRLEMEMVKDETEHSIQQVLAEMREKALDGAQASLDHVRTEMDIVKVEARELLEVKNKLTSDVMGLKNDMKDLRQEIEVVKEDLKRIAFEVTQERESMEDEMRGMIEQLKRERALREREREREKTPEPVVAIQRPGYNPSYIPVPRAESPPPRSQSPPPNRGAQHLFRRSTWWGPTTSGPLVPPRPPLIPPPPPPPPPPPTGASSSSQPPYPTVLFTDPPTGSSNERGRPRHLPRPPTVQDDATNGNGSNVESASEMNGPVPPSKNALTPYGLRRLDALDRMLLARGGRRQGNTNAGSIPETTTTNGFGYGQRVWDAGRDDTNADSAPEMIPNIRPSSVVSNTPNGRARLQNRLSMPSVRGWSPPWAHSNDGNNNEFVTGTRNGPPMQSDGNNNLGSGNGPSHPFSHHHRQHHFNHSHHLPLPPHFRHPYHHHVNPPHHHHQHLHHTHQPVVNQIATIHRSGTKFAPSRLRRTSSVPTRMNATPFVDGGLRFSVVPEVTIPENPTMLPSDSEPVAPVSNASGLSSKPSTETISGPPGGTRIERSEVEEARKVYKARKAAWRKQRDEARKAFMMQTQNGGVTVTEPGPPKRVRPFDMMTIPAGRLNGFELTRMPGSLPGISTPQPQVTPSQSGQQQQPEGTVPPPGFQAQQQQQPGLSAPLQRWPSVRFAPSPPPERRPEPRDDSTDEEVPDLDPRPPPRPPMKPLQPVRLYPTGFGPTDNHNLSPSERQLKNSIQEKLNNMGFGPMETQITDMVEREVREEMRRVHGRPHSADTVSMMERLVEQLLMNPFSNITNINNSRNNHVRGSAPSTRSRSISPQSRRLIAELVAADSAAAGSIPGQWN